VAPAGLGSVTVVIASPVESRSAKREEEDRSALIDGAHTESEETRTCTDLLAQLCEGLLDL
jgi:hypothetical protein